jgi:hypothetical protein
MPTVMSYNNECVLKSYCIFHVYSRKTVNIPRFQQTVVDGVG